ncbi:sensor domain-containing diguanylate cyclase [Candidatus Magnetominusculus xianensis]|uniref:Signal transduction protein n=1 Tax=Candidatus Magnetominusculus xianensis TaxID=1748249 RepID=A0ABR5SJU6_9BACT|nr:sensor domain-containing diguanylate cyclase [Candidatus Magnetominusculus xianensis]KWT95111.1 signal transduction protein [Candidatus Magnetominusculus xianensis]MBF0402758.1 sensor domain-containing diguanylate cyclase [Nitrospirota bacterium]
MKDENKKKAALIDELKLVRRKAAALEESLQECINCEANLRESEKRFQIMANSAPVFIWMASVDGSRWFFNKVWLDYTGRTLDEEKDDNWMDNIHPDDIEGFRESYAMAIGIQKPFKLDYRLRRNDGVYRWVLDTGTPRFTHEGMFAGFIGSCVGISERKEAEEQLQHIAHFDLLTDLPNRFLFFDRMNQAIEQAKRYSHSIALLFLDLNRFKSVNDTLGHHAGDILLKETAKRLTNCVRHVDTVARMGGDEFNIILSKVHERSDVQSVAEKIIDTISVPFYIEGMECSIGVSIGISMYPMDSSETATLIQHADLAMYKAKATGESSYYFSCDNQRG